MYIREVDVTKYEDFDSHEKVVRCQDNETGLLAYIAIHNTNLGPALGGCRIWPYECDDDAVKDVLRLSRGMTYKSAISNLPLGGGKSVIISDAKKMKTKAMMKSMGRFVESLHGAYITAEDSGTSVDDLKIMSAETKFVTGVLNKRLTDGSEASGDPSPSTAYGVFVGIKASLQYRFGTSDPAGVKVAVQGVGNVGRNLVRMLAEAGAEVFISDTYAPAIERTLEGCQVKVVHNASIHQLDVDVYSPCALGGALNMASLVEMCAPIIAGAANNQLTDTDTGDYLFHKGIVYAPDYVINAGGIIDIFYEREGYDHARVIDHINSIAATLADIFALSEQNQISTNATADRIAETRFLDLEKVA